MRTDTKKAPSGFIRVKLRRLPEDAHPWWEVWSLTDYKRKVQYRYTPNEVQTDAREIRERRLPP